MYCFARLLGENPMTQIRDGFASFFGILLIVSFTVIVQEHTYRYVQTLQNLQKLP